jgi:hypothetical protein
MKNQFSLLAWSDFYWLRTVGPAAKVTDCFKSKMKIYKSWRQQMGQVMTSLLLLLYLNVYVKNNMTVIVSKYCVDSYLFEKLSQKNHIDLKKYM